MDRIAQMSEHRLTALTRGCPSYSGSMPDGAHHLCFAGTGYLRPNRMRSRLIGNRTAVINQLRGFLLEHGIAVRQVATPKC